MSKRIAAVLTALLLFSALTVNALAEGEGSLRIDLRGSGSPISGAQIRVYLVGTPVKGGYRLTETFGGGLIAEADVFSPELAVWLSRLASGGWQGATNREGTVKFQGLEEGLYLVTQDGSAGGYRPFESFLITIPWDGVQWEIAATPKTERDDPFTPETSDPGIADKGLLGIALSGTGLILLILGKKRFCP